VLRRCNDIGVQLASGCPVGNADTTTEEDDVNTWFSRARDAMSFANVTSALALFIALGGTSYAAVSLSRDNVGSWHIRSGAVGKSEVRRSAVSASEIRRNGVRPSEIRRDAVGPSEIRPNAVSADEIADGGVEAADLSAAARSAVAAANAVNFRTAATAAGAIAGGDAKSISHAASSGVYTVDLGEDVSACHYAATIGAVKTGSGIQDPPTNVGLVTASPSTDASKVVVKTFDVAGSAVEAPFHLLVAC
jgi:hypothetical protein